jgi:class 3 adenylate cyclase
LRDTAVGYDGHVVETRADEFFAVFEQPAAALTMALTVQRELRTRVSAGDEDVRVRVGIHSGYPTLAKANYLGMAVHTAARICGVSHGGQIVVSGDFRTAIGVPLPNGVRLRKLGRTRYAACRTRSNSTKSRRKGSSPASRRPGFRFELTNPDRSRGMR